MPHIRPNIVCNTVLRGAPASAAASSLRCLPDSRPLSEELTSGAETYGEPAAAPRTILSLHRSSAVGAKIFVSCISMTISANHDRIKQTPCAIVFPPAAGRRGTSSPYYTAKETSIGISVRKPHLPDRRARIRLYPITAELYRPQLPVSDIIIQCQRAACKEEALYNLIRI